MSTWILMLVIYGDGLHTLQFESEAQCETARAAMTEQLRKWLANPELDAVCLEVTGSTLDDISGRVQ